MREDDADAVVSPGNSLRAGLGLFSTEPLAFEETKDDSDESLCRWRSDCRSGFFCGREGVKELDTGGGGGAGSRGA